MNDQLPPPTHQAPPPPPPQYAPPGFENPQYVITHKSRHGIGGWLGVWMVLFMFGAITYIPWFFGLVSSDDPNPVDVIFTPLLAALCVAAIVLIATRRALGRWVAMAPLAGTWLWSTIRILDSGGSAAAKASGILVIGVIEGALILYFVQSDRVRQTLIN